MDFECILVTGSAGFIGAALSKYLLKKGYKVIGLDNLNSYYDVALKKARLRNIEKTNNNNSNWKFFNFSIEEKDQLNNLLAKYRPEVVVNLAAQAGVRYSLENPYEYIQSNLVGFGNILESCKTYKVQNFIFASSSSVYGGNKELPFKENHNVDQPLSLYAATKISNEVMAHSYSYLYKIPSTGLRFFTVYGPWGRPDMAPMIFTKAIQKKHPIKIFNNGDMYRDFTYIDDIVESIYRCCKKPANTNYNSVNTKPLPENAFGPYKIFNIGNGKPINLNIFIEILEKELGEKAIKIFEPMQLGDVKATIADTKKLRDWIDFKPKTDLEDGIKPFIEWYKNYY